MLKPTFDNPVIVKEFRSRMRGSRAYWMLFGYLSLLSLTLFLAYLAWCNQPRYRMEAGGSGTEAYTVGRNFFLILFAVQALLIALITPALTAGAISLEREQRTFEMLRATTLTPRRIVLGKLAASVSFVVLLLTASLPLVSLCFLLGGVSPGEVFFAYLLLVSDAFLFGAVGLAWSAHAGGTGAATALSYGTLFLFFIGTFQLSVPLLSGGGNTALAALNPVGAVLGAVTPEKYFGWTLPAWVPALLLNAAAGALLTLSCINRLDDFPTRRALSLRLSTLLLAGLIVFFVDGVIFNRPGLHSGQMTLAAFAGLIVLLIFVPVMATGDGAETGKRGSFLAQATLADGLPFSLLLLAVTLAVFGLALVLTGPVGTARGLMFGQAVLLLGAVTFGIGGLGRLLSVALGSRWLSLTMLTLSLVLLIVVPHLSYSSLYAEDAARAAHTVGVRTLYLSPFVSLQDLSVTGDGGPPLERQIPAAAQLRHGRGTMWLITALLYLALGALGLQTAASIIRKRTAAKKSA